uniref:Uncharacterized protein n=1 Tax=Candidatus Kentrum sp. DK TaxID=2126562 RepID=A0A450SGD0_9GAMM|nr:MAG: hypothetical protein BECKDK2373B_GA0170837_103530 [Candidatus Kentron sp. DK]
MTYMIFVLLLPILFFFPCTAMERELHVDCRERKVVPSDYGVEKGEINKLRNLVPHELREEEKCRFPWPAVYLTHLVTLATSQNSKEVAALLLFDASFYDDLRLDGEFAENYFPDMAFPVFIANTHVREMDRDAIAEYAEVFCDQLRKEGGVITVHDYMSGIGTVYDALSIHNKLESNGLFVLSDKIRKKCGYVQFREPENH